MLRSTSALQPIFTCLTGAFVTSWMATLVVSANFQQMPLSSRRQQSQCLLQAEKKIAATAMNMQQRENAGIEETCFRQGNLTLTWLDEAHCKSSALPRPVGSLSDCHLKMRRSNRECPEK